MLTVNEADGILDEVENCTCCEDSDDNCGIVVVNVDVETDEHDEANISGGGPCVIPPLGLDWKVAKAGVAPTFEMFIFCCCSNCCCCICKC